MKWQPIETAPKDGTPILAYRGDHYKSFGHVQVTYWRTAAHKVGYIGWGEFNQRWWPPTHWMPLPEPPRQPPDSNLPAGSQGSSESGAGPYNFKCPECGRFISDVAVGHADWCFLKS